MNPALLAYIAKLSASDKKTLSQKGLKAGEELGELAKAILPYDNAASTTHRFVRREKIVEECVDVILCALSIAYNVDATDEDIESTMMRKAQYWEELQNREDKVKYPLPYEIHITVAAGTNGIDLETFKATCVGLGVKPLLIDMHNRQGGTVMLDAQTSSVFMGDNRGALLEAKRIANGLLAEGFDVVREKIETVPWHPAAPYENHLKPVMPPHCYFEAHFNIVVNDETVSILRELVNTFDGAHLSRNAFKKISDTDYVIMATLRNYEGTYEDFKKDCDHLVSFLTENGFNVPKTITEFSIYDTKVSHDSAWLEQ
jgi:NTP pyrophosphatase (non-canonical NTP hydrolase)